MFERLAPAARPVRHIVVPVYFATDRAESGDARSEHWFGPPVAGRRLLSFSLAPLRHGGVVLALDLSQINGRLGKCHVERFHVQPVEPMVRIRFPPAASLQTLGPSREIGQFQARVFTLSREHLLLGFCVRKMQPVARWLIERRSRLTGIDTSRNQEAQEHQWVRETQMTASRREILGRAAGALTGLAFTGCGLVSAASAQAPQRRREVVVNGKRIRTIDVHAHCHVPEANALMGLKVQFPSLVVSPERIEAMDAQGIDLETLSINPIFWYKAEPDLAGQVVKLQNEKLAEICAAQSDRFVGLASVALQHPELAAEQLEVAVKQLGLRGTLVGGSVNGEELSDLKFHPFWAKAEQLGALIFIHPQGTAELNATGRLKGNGVLDNVIGNPLETTIALSHLIFEGTLDAYPGLKICAAHAGGYLPSYAARSDQGCVTFPARCTKTLKKKPSEYLRQLYYDSMVFTPEGLRHLIAEVGASQIVLGTDYPFPWTKTAVDHILGTPGLSDEERIAILGANAEKLLTLKPA